MNPTETTALVRYIAEVFPSMRINQHTPDAWHPLLKDVPASLAREAVQYLAKTSSGYIAPADIRRRVAEFAGLLPPGEDDAWERVLSVASADGVGRSQLHPVLQGVYSSMGGAAAIKAGLPGPTRAAFGQAYRRLADEHQREVLSTDLEWQIPPPSLVAHQAAELTS